MTVICTDGVTIAADGLTTFNIERSRRPKKKIVVEGGRIYAACGSSLLSALIAWHKAGAEPRNLPVGGSEKGWNLLVIDDSGISLYDSDLPYPEQVEPPFAIGSGAEYALGAMSHGASPEQAVEIAIQWVTNCGRPIQVENIAEARFRGLKRPSSVREAAE